MKEEIRYLSLCGMLGYGYAPESLENAFAGKLDFIGVESLEKYKSNIIQNLYNAFISS